MALDVTLSSSKGQDDIENDLEALTERLRASTVAVRLGRDGAGSGVIWSSDGTIVTNAHVASRPQAEIVLSDGRRFTGRVERRDVPRDLALLVAVGHPLGIPNAVTMGIAHATVGDGGRRFVQADVMLAPGNSGGPLADARGRVVGINSMVVGGLALAVPSDDVQRFTGAQREPSLLGVRLAPARLRDGRTALAVVELERGGRGERAGLIVGDILLARDAGRLRFATSLDVLRGGVRIAVPIPPETASARAA